ncbi:MAG: hypothetical protein U9R36_01085, partial [Elusimicrobiota bacterium]|nr:hypothetical protein [Elusimicrobiota bacterium]
MGGTNNIPEPEIKETPWGEKYRKELESIYGTDLEMTEFEKAGLRSLQAAAAGQLPDIYKTGRGAIRDVAAGGTDVMTSPLYRGLRQELEREQAETIAGIRRGQQAGGMLQSTPTARAVGETATQFAGERLSLLGKLIREEDERRLRAAGKAAQLGEFESRTLPATLLQYGA